jgi:DNA-binding GntR family transcriptional regulator
VPRPPRTATSANGPARVRGAHKRARGSGADTIYDELRRDILNLTMEPGTLLDETELAERFSLSRSPVREALIRLAAEGLVQTLRNRSSIVAPFDVVAMPSYLDAVQLIYRLTARLAALNRKPAQLTKIKELQQEHAAAAKRGDFLNMIRLNHAFHEAIAKASGNSFYVAWTRQVLDHVGGKMDNRAVRDHLAMVRAIEAQDPDGAEAAARRDAEIISGRMRDMFGSQPSGALSVAPHQK